MKFLVWLVAPERLSVALEIASALLACVVCVFHIIRDHRSKQHTDPITVLARAAGLGILPQALLIVSATFYPNLLCEVAGLRVFFMLSGLSLFYVCFRSVTS